MQEKENIEQLFREAFRNYEEPVRPELWTKVSAAINATPPPADISTVVSNTFSSGTGIFSNITAWIGGALIVASSALGVYYITKKPVENNVEPVVTAPANSNSINERVAKYVGPAESSTNAGYKVKNNSTTASSATQNNNIKEENINTSSSSKNAIDISEVNSLQHDAVTEAQKTTKEETNTHTNNAILNNSETDVNEAGPVNIFNASPASGIAPLKVNFSYDGDVNKTEWAFGDGNPIVHQKNVEHTFTQPGNYNVTLKVYDENGKARLINRTIEVLTDLQIKHIPNIFTPNNDGINDVFTFEAPNIVELEVLIYDQSGRVMNKWTGDKNGWDGNLNNGQPAPEGTYLYIIFATGQNQQQHQQKGTITLKR